MKKRRGKVKEAQCDVFISYRRDGGEMTALYVSQELKRRGYRVFYDRENLRAPVRFNERLLDSIRSCTDFVLILSPHALDRCVNEDDWVRTEIEEALKSGKNIVPVAMNGFEYPANLPESIAEIRYIQAMSPSMDFFTESMNRLCDDFLMTRLHAGRKWTVPLVAGVALALLAVAAALFATGVLPPSPSAAPSPAPELTPAPTPEPTPTPEITPTPEPTPTPTPEPTPEPTADAAESLEASVQLALFAPNGSLLELLGDRATLDMADYPKGCYIAPRLSLDNPGGADASYSLSLLLDGAQAGDWPEQVCPAGETTAYSAGADDPELARGMTPGKHTAAYSLNGRALAPFEYEIAEDPREDPREALGFEPSLSVYDSEGRFVDFQPGAAGNARTLPDGEAYGYGLRLISRGEAKQFSLTAIDSEGNVWLDSAQPQTLEAGESRTFSASRPLPGAGGHEVTWYVNGYALLTFQYMIADEDPSAVCARLDATVDLVLCAPDGTVLESWGDAAPLDMGEYPEGCYYALRIALRNTSDEAAAVFTLNGKLDGVDFSFSGQACGALSRMSLSPGGNVMRPFLTQGRHTATFDVDGEALTSFEFEFTPEKRADIRDALNEVANMAVFDDAGRYISSMPSASGDLNALPGGEYRIGLSLGNHGEDAEFRLVALDAQGRLVTNMEAPQSLSQREWKRFFGADGLTNPGTYEITWYVNGYPLPPQTYDVTGGTLEASRNPLEASVRLALYAPHGAIVELLSDSEVLDTADYPEGSFIAPVLELKNPTGEDAVFSLAKCIDGNELFADQETCPAGETVLFGYHPSHGDPAQYMTLGRHTASYILNGEDLISFEYELTDGKRADLRDGLILSPMLSVYDAEGNLLRFERGSAANLRLLPEGGRYGAAIEIANLGEDVQFHLSSIADDGTIYYEPEVVRIARGETMRFSSGPLPEETSSWTVYWAVDGYIAFGENYTFVDENPSVASNQLETGMQLALAASDSGVLELWNERAPMDKGGFPKGCLYAPQITIHNAGTRRVVLALTGSLDGREFDRSWIACAPGGSESRLLGLEAAALAQTAGRHTLTYRINDGETLSYEFELTDEPRADLRDKLSAEAYFAVHNRHAFERNIPGALIDLRQLPYGGGYFAPTLMLQYEGEDASIHIALTDENGRARLSESDIYYEIYLQSGQSMVLDAPPMLTDQPQDFNLIWYANGYPILKQTYTITSEDR